jgi:hypothetical protein
MAEAVGDQVEHPSVTEAALELERAEEARRLAPTTTSGPARWKGSSALSAAIGVGAAIVGAIGIVAGAVLLGIVLLASGAVLIAAALVVWRTRANRQPVNLAVDARVRAAEDALLTALTARGVTGSTQDPRSTLRHYVEAVRARAAAAAEIPTLRQAAGDRAALERRIEADRTAAQDAEKTLEDAYRRIFPDADTGVSPAEILGQLQAWQKAEVDAMKAHETDLVEWEDLQHRLGGRTMSELRADAERAETDARAAEAALVGQQRPEGSIDLAEASATLDRLVGEMTAMERRLPSVVDAEEACVEAEMELARVRELEGILDETHTLLAGAQDKVHRTIAPQLNLTLNQYLPQVTGDAYDQAKVDPANLEISVRETASGRDRKAHFLSQGTREQIYLLLRVAMARLLVRPGTSAPILLDDAVAHADEHRKKRMLRVLHDLSADQQIVLFTLDSSVVSWAHEAFVGDRDLLQHLPYRSSANQSGREGATPK